MALIVLPQSPGQIDCYTDIKAIEAAAFDSINKNHPARIFEHTLNGRPTPAHGGSATTGRAGFRLARPSRGGLGRLRRRQPPWAANRCSIHLSYGANFITHCYYIYYANSLIRLNILNALQ